MEQGPDQPRGRGYLYAVRDEEAYLETDGDDKPEPIAGPPPDPDMFKRWFCRKRDDEVEMLFGAPFPVRDPLNFSHETPIFICNRCVARYAERYASRTKGTAD